MRYLTGLTVVLLFAFMSGVLIAPPTPHERLQQTEGVVIFNGPSVASLSFIDQTGKAVQTESLQGRWNLLFFGYTFCPDVCPLTLMQMGQLWKELTPEQTARLAAVLVSVDPQRDTPEALLPYMSYFNPEFRALTGNPDSLRTLATQLNAFYDRVERPQTGDYLMNHSANLILIDPQGTYRGYIEPPFTSERLRPVVTALLNGAAD